MDRMLIALLLSVFFCRGVAQPIVMTTAPDESVDNARLARIDTLVKDYISKGWVTGLSHLW